MGKKYKGMIYSMYNNDVYIIIYVTMMNSNNSEYQYRDTIDLDYFRITLGIDGWEFKV